MIFHVARSGDVSLGPHRLIKGRRGEGWSETARGRA